MHIIKYIFIEFEILTAVMTTVFSWVWQCVYSQVDTYKSMHCRNREKCRVFVHLFEYFPDRIKVKLTYETYLRYEGNISIENFMKYFHNINNHVKPKC
jgi:predicted nucleotide-binding protein (sugar kinase/HSP70/actin superfamily)